MHVSAYKDTKYEPLDIILEAQEEVGNRGQFKDCWGVQMCNKALDCIVDFLSCIKKDKTSIHLNIPSTVLKSIIDFLSCNKKSV